MRQIVMGMRTGRKRERAPIECFGNVLRDAKNLSENHQPHGVRRG
jgi:hypothetical protein